MIEFDRELAACRDKPSKWWFPERGGRHDIYKNARRICAECPTRMGCLELALEREPLGSRYGMFGGLTPDERDRLRRAS